MEDEIEMTRRNTATNSNPERNRRPRVQINPLEEDAPPNREPFDPLTILVPVTDAVLIILAVIVAISCVITVATGILGFLRSYEIISEGTLGAIFCKYVKSHPELCTLWA